VSTDINGQEYFLYITGGEYTIGIARINKLQQ
jgi:hypothetical protein